MEAKAYRLGVQGVAVASIVYLENPNEFSLGIRIVGRFQRPPDATKDKGDTGVNYLAVAVSKVAESFETHNPSGLTFDRQPKLGEFGYRGCVIAETDTMILLSSFSGGTEGEDVVIAWVGLDLLCKMFRGSR
jgi:hypothetical protein